MVSFWPWKSGEDAASFERTLDTLSAKIKTATATNDRQRHLSRRARVMWTLYAGFAYILAALLLTLVTGWRNWDMVESTVVAGGPVVIYGIRYALTAYFNYRISNTDAYLAKLNKERDITIERLKEATKYNSTQQLLEKYGAAPKQKELNSSSGGNQPQGPQKPAQPQGPRTGFAPPPTANIQRVGTPQRHQLPTNQPLPEAMIHRDPTPRQQSIPPVPPGAEFAPNAFTATNETQRSTASATTFTQAHWYDRILDALLGEDETAPKNRFVLICCQCCLVNGQAPPGAKLLEDVGRWRCGGCGAWNGKEKKGDDIEGLVKGWEEAKRQNVRQGGPESASVVEREREDKSLVEPVEDSESSDEVVPTPPPSRGTRSRAKGKGKK